MLSDQLEVDNVYSSLKCIDNKDREMGGWHSGHSFRPHPHLGIWFSADECGLIAGRAGHFRGQLSALTPQRDRSRRLQARVQVIKPHMHEKPIVLCSW